MLYIYKQYIYMYKNQREICYLRTIFFCNIFKLHDVYKYLIRSFFVDISKKCLY